MYMYAIVLGQVYKWSVKTILLWIFPLNLHSFIHNNNNNWSK